MTDLGTINLAWSQTLVGGLAAAGISHAVLSPGSRSTPLALACLRHRGLTCELIVDERSAAFFALGLAKATGRPPLLIATSGTGPANWLPAVIEASMAGIPLLLVSADRPPELHACGANQTVAQTAMFAPYLRAAHALEAPGPGIPTGWLPRLAAQAVEEATWPLPGPVHLNQPFREPLVAQTAVATPPPPRPITIFHPEPEAAPSLLADLAARIGGRPGTILCCGDAVSPDLAAAIVALAEALDCPILAEPQSGLRHGAHDRRRVLCHGAGWLRDTSFLVAHRPQWLLRFGPWPVSRCLQDFAADPAIESFLVDPRPGWRDPANAAREILRVSPLGLCRGLIAQRPAPAPEGWCAAFAAADSRAAAAIDDLPVHTEGRILPALLGCLPANHPVFIGNSLVIRDLDAFDGGGERPLRFFANRGASGIDGNVSTALGIATAAGRVVALLGDLATQHDLGGLANARGKPAVFVVFNNGGGGIFDHLPQAQLPEFERGWLTPQDIDFHSAAATFGIAYAQADDAPSAASALRAALDADGPTLLEIRLDRAASVAARLAWQAACRSDQPSSQTRD